MTYACYSAIDTEGSTLYIGQTSDLARRKREHARLAPWWPLAVCIEVVEWVTTRAEALDLEAYLIKACHPLFNQVHGDAAAAREYVELASQEAAEQVAS